MAVRLILCRRKDTGAEAELPETALRYGHIPAYEPVDEADRDRIRELQTADEAAAAQAEDDAPSTAAPDSASSAPSAPADTPTSAKSKPATGAAKKTKESRNGD